VVAVVAVVAVAVAADVVAVDVVAVEDAGDKRKELLNRES
jgi:hypothetical protein